MWKSEFFLAQIQYGLGDKYIHTVNEVVRIENKKFNENLKRLNSTNVPDATSLREEANLQFEKELKELYNNSRLFEKGEIGYIGERRNISGKLLNSTTSFGRHSYTKFKDFIQGVQTYAGIHIDTYDNNKEYYILCCSSISVITKGLGSNATLSGNQKDTKDSRNYKFHYALDKKTFDIYFVFTNSRMKTKTAERTKQTFQKAVDVYRFVKESTSAAKKSKEEAAAAAKAAAAAAKEADAKAKREAAAAKEAKRKSEQAAADVSSKCVALSKASIREHKRKVPGDGSCMFHAVQQSIEFKEPYKKERGFQLRKELLSYIERFKADVLETLDINDADYRTLRMRVADLKEYAQNKEIQLLSKMLDICIVVHYKDSGELVEQVFSKGRELLYFKKGSGQLDLEKVNPLCCRAKNIVHLYNEREIHFEPIIIPEEKQKIAAAAKEAAVAAAIAAKEAAAAAADAKAAQEAAALELAIARKKAAEEVEREKAAAAEEAAAKRKSEQEAAAAKEAAAAAELDRARKKAAAAKEAADAKAAREAAAAKKEAALKKLKTGALAASFGTKLKNQAAATREAAAALKAKQEAANAKAKQEAANAKAKQEAANAKAKQEAAAPKEPAGKAGVGDCSKAVKLVCDRKEPFGPDELFYKSLCEKCKITKKEAIAAVTTFLKINDITGVNFNDKMWTKTEKGKQIYNKLVNFCQARYNSEIECTDKKGDLLLTNDEQEFFEHIGKNICKFNPEPDSQQSLDRCQLDNIERVGKRLQHIKAQHTKK